MAKLRCSDCVETLKSLSATRFLVDKTSAVAIHYEVEADGSFSVHSGSALLLGRCSGKGAVRNSRRSAGTEQDTLAAARSWPRVATADAAALRVGRPLQ